MFCVCDDNYLSMYRGDTFRFSIDINKGTKLDYDHYVLTDKDTIYVSIREYNQSFENSLIHTMIDSSSPVDDKGNPIFELAPEQTELLKTGKYFITIKLKQENDVVTTILSPREFWILGSDKEVI